MSDGTGTKAQPIPPEYERPKQRPTTTPDFAQDSTEALEWGDGGGAVQEILSWGDADAAEAAEPDPELLVAEDESRLLIRIEHDDSLGLGNVGWFLQEVDDVILAAKGAAAPRAEIESIRSGSLTIIITAGGATLAWKIFQHFQTQWIEKKRRDEAWAREDLIRQQQQAREDAIRREQYEREDAQRAEDRQRAAAPTDRLDPNMTNIIIVTGSVRLEVDAATKPDESLAPA